jgi:CubicO group peptidase (beta-lactamase class C family)
MKYLILLLILITISVVVIVTQLKGSAKSAKPSTYYVLLSADSVLDDQVDGFSDVLQETSPDQDTQYALYSITKTFTATAILQMQAAGKLSIDDAASDYLPDYNFLKGVTIRHLLAHQSGLNNPLPLKWVHLVEEDATFDYKGFSSTTLFEQARQKKNPGTKPAYSNLNYLLLGEIIEKISGKSFQAYMIENLQNYPGIDFRWSDQHAAKGYHPSGVQALILGLLIDKKKYAYQQEVDYLTFRHAYVNGPAYGGLIASPKALQVYLKEFLKEDSQILSNEAKRQMFREQLLSDGTASGHSLGWFTGKLQDHSYVCHAGGGGGYYAEVRIYPELKLASFMLSNQSGFSDKRILDKYDLSYISRH